jgi:Fe-S-cluster-containing dehydrogenase component
MKKCTLCIDRIYNENIAEEERQPACVRACPAKARHFGDLADPRSEVSRLVAERGGSDLMPEMGYKPTNKYLPPRSGAPAGNNPPAITNEADEMPAEGFWAWLDRVLDDGN